MKNKKELIVGDIITAEFVKNQKEGKKPIIIHDGLVGFVHRTYRGMFLQEHSIWQFEVMEIKERTITVMPIQIVKSAQANLAEINERMKVLGTKHPPKHKRTKKSYPFKSKQQFLSERKN